MKNAPHKKLQSAMEYLMTYGWAILIIAVVIGVLYAMGIFNGSGLLGSFCTAQTGYFCANPILSTNSPTLNVTIGQDTRLEWPAWKIFAVRGTTFNASSPNITGSGAFYNGEKQIVTIPLNSILGNYIPIGTPFSGSLWAEYCNTPNCNTPDQVSEIGIFYTKAAKLGYVTTSVSTSSISTTSTTSTSTTSTSTTSITTPAPTITIAPSGIIYSVPITLTNSQSSNTPAPFQQMVNISESTYSSYLTYNGNFANFEYYTLSGNTVSVLPAWIESSNSGKLITWVKLPNGIPAKSSITIYLGFASNTVNLLSSSGTTGIGEAPQLGPTYAEYDDGASVFLIYFDGNTPLSDFNFEGNTGSQVSTTGPTGTTINVISISGYASNLGFVYTAKSISNQPIIAESSSQQNGLGNGGLGADNGQAGVVDGTSTSSLNAIDVSMGSRGNYFTNDYFSGGSGTQALNNQGTANANWHYASVTYAGSSATSWSGYIAPQLYSTSGGYSGTVSNNPLSSSSTLYLGLIGGISSSYAWQTYINWLRARAYPPNDVMPSTAFGSVQ